MNRGQWSRGITALALAVLGQSALAAEPRGGGVLGWVEDSHGSPVAGAVVSLFGTGLGSTGLVTLTDSAGRFFLPGLPAGSYTLRALKGGQHVSSARRVVVLPGRDATFTVSIAAAADRAAATLEKTRKEDGRRELEWLVRHKPRSVLEDSDGRRDGAEGDVRASVDESSLALGYLDGRVELLTTPQGEDARMSAVHLEGRLSERSRWTLGGIVAERQSATWRMAGSFAWEPGGGHTIEASTGYGVRALRSADGFGGPPGDRGVGAVSLEDRWQVVDGITTTIGGRFTYIGFLERSHTLDPRAAVAIRPDEDSTLRLSVARRTLPPGGDVLTLNATSGAPALEFGTLAPGMPPERLTRYEVGIDEVVGRGTTLGVFAYYEGVQDQLVNVVDGPALRLLNGGRAATRGMGLSVHRSFGDAVQGSMVYTFGRTARHETQPGQYFTPWHDGDFHDLAARVETAIPATDTRVMAFYRVNLVLASAGGEGTEARTPVSRSRFDVQLSQGLPFLGALTHADWDVLLAVRNLFYDSAEAGVLDEVVVVNPPKRLLGGISVRF